MSTTPAPADVGLERAGGAGRSLAQLLEQLLVLGGGAALAQLCYAAVRFDVSPATLRLFAALETAAAAAGVADAPTRNIERAGCARWARAVQRQARA